MARSDPPQPEQDFRITTFAWQLDNEANHRNAGFPEISQDILIRRFWQFLSFLQDNRFTNRIIASCPTDITPETELRNSDLTAEGYLYVQRYCDRWVARTYKDTGEATEARFLVKWLNQFRAKSVDA